MVHIEYRTCPRCHSPFSCDGDTEETCNCNQLHLTPAEEVFINSRYSDCLCLECLAELKAEFELLHTDVEFMNSVEESKYL